MPRHGNQKRYIIIDFLLRDAKDSDVRSIYQQIFAEIFKASGLTQRQFAEKHGMAQPVVSQCLNGKRQYPLEDMQRIGAVYNLEFRITVEVVDKSPRVTRKFSS